MLSIFLSLVWAEQDISVRGNQFTLDGGRLRLYSGSFDYFRHHPKAWAREVEKIVSCGLNTVQVSVPWNLHEPEKGKFNFEGGADVMEFIDMCAGYNLYVILRPGPYIGSEWDFGGFPSWLLTENIKQFRSMDPVFIKHVDDWFSVLLQRVRSYMFDNGGNVIMVQLEHMYGDSGICDKKYMEHLYEFSKNILGNGAFLLTTDRPVDSAIQCGALPGKAHVTVAFGPETPPADAFAVARNFNKNGPGMNMALPIAEPDKWRVPHVSVTDKVFAEQYGEQLRLGASVNIKMFGGGTTFQFYNGAEGNATHYFAYSTSHYPNSPVTEDGEMTGMWKTVLNTILRHRKRRELESYPVENPKRLKYGQVKFTEGVSLVDAVTDVGDKVVKAENVKSFEELGLAFGFVVYKTTTNGGTLEIEKVRDMAVILVNGKRIKKLMRYGEKKVEIPKGTLQILVENMGRISDGKTFDDYKGVFGVKLNGEVLTGWEMTTLPLTDISSIPFSSKRELPVGVPAFYKGVFDVQSIGETFLDPSGFIKGVVFVNGFNIGRYWRVGPQLTLYVPSNVLRVGRNELIVFETGKIESVGEMELVDRPKRV